MKRFFKVIAVFMIVILCGGALATFFDFGSDEPTGPGTTVQTPEKEDPSTEDPEEPSCTHVDADDNELCDLCGETYSDGQDLFGGTVTNEVDFSASILKDISTSIETNVVQDGYSVGGVKAGTVTTSDGYLKFSTDAAAEESYSDVDSLISLYVNSASHQGYEKGIDLYAFDYMTLDFDIWTDSEYFDVITLRLQGQTSDKATALDTLPHIRILRNEDGSYIIASDTYEALYTITEPTERLHITYAIKVEHSNMANSSVQLYVNGEYISNAYSNLSESMYYMSFLRVYFSTSFAKDGRSICFDNLQACTYGNGDGAYLGAISELFGDTSINLTECVDSVLYNKN